jgi:hypothetical protein
MEHIVTIAFDFDDKAVSDKIEASAAKIVIDKIVHDVEGRIFSKSGWGGGKIDPQKDPLSSFTERIVRDFLEDNKDNVIEKAAVMLADSYKRTKAWKEKASEQMEG